MHAVAQHRRTSTVELPRVEEQADELGQNVHGHDVARQGRLPHLAVQQSKRPVSTIGPSMVEPGVAPVLRPDAVVYVVALLVGVVVLLVGVVLVAPAGANG